MCRARKSAECEAFTQCGHRQLQMTRRKKKRKRARVQRSSVQSPQNGQACFARQVRIPNPPSRVRAGAHLKAQRPEDSVLPFPVPVLLPSQARVFCWPGAAGASVRRLRFVSRGFECASLTAPSSETPLAVREAEDACDSELQSAVPRCRHSRSTTEQTARQIQ